MKPMKGVQNIPHLWYEQLKNDGPGGMVWSQSMIDRTVQLLQLPLSLVEVLPLSLVEVLPLSLVEVLVLPLP